jgi:hypothetical protein
MGSRANTVHLVTRAVALVLVTIAGARLHAQMVTGAKMPGYATAFGLTAAEHATDYTVQEIAVKTVSGTMANVLLPHEAATFTFRFVNKTKLPIHATAVFHAINYQTRTPVGDVWTPHVTKLAEGPDTPVEVSLAASGFQDVSITPAIGERFGGYALIAEVPGHGRAFAAALVRSISPDTGRVQYPTTHWTRRGRST